MKHRQKKHLEAQLIQALQRRFGDPNSEAPLTLRDQPNEIVYTALRPKKAREERAGPMAFGQVPTITVEAQNPALQGFEEPRGMGDSMVEAMMARTAAPQQAQQQAQRPALPQTQAGPPQQRPQRSEQEMLQELLVTG